jgi:hypothetical protein
MENEGQSAKSWITDGIMIAAITAFAYVLSFLYEAGFCTSFNIPLSFISLSLTTILTAAGGLFIVIIMLFGVIHILYMIGILDTKNPVSLAFQRTTLFSLLLLANVLLYGRCWIGWIRTAGTLLFFLLLEFIFPLITQRGKGSYRDKLTAQVELEQEARSFGNILRTRFGNMGVIMFLIIWYGLMTAHTAGRAQAHQQEEFLVIDHSPEVVVLRIYGEYLITAPFDRSTKEIEKKLYIFMLSDNSPTLLTLEKAGPLKVKP